MHLYTDSLKKGTYNYINIDGKLSSGSYLPLDSTDIIFSASDGKFYGNTLWIDPHFSKDKITIKAVLRSNPSMFKQFDVYIKKKPDPAKLKSVDEILNEMQKPKKGRSPHLIVEGYGFVHSTLNYFAYSLRISLKRKFQT